MSHPFPAQADVKREKVKVLRSVRPLDAEHDLVVGQFDGYADDPSVADKATTTETFAAARLFIDNPRWAGVPFVLSAGKALEEKKVEVRIRFHAVAGAVADVGDAAPNELVIRVQQGRKRVIQDRFNTSVPRAIVPETASTRRERSER